MTKAELKAIKIAWSYNVNNLNLTRTSKSLFELLKEILYTFLTFLQTNKTI